MALGLVSAVVCIKSLSRILFYTWGLLLRFNNDFLFDEFLFSAAAHLDVKKLKVPEAFT
jgi:hypothetical protein